MRGPLEKCTVFVVTSDFSEDVDVCFYPLQNFVVPEGADGMIVSSLLPVT
jgi:hypothetical protein